MTATPPEIVAGLLLVFALPGYAITKATFPEWRLQGANALLRIVEVGTLSLVLSVTVTILVGFVLGNLPGSFFQAGWTDPLLEVILASISAVGLAVAVLRGGFSKTPPAAPAIERSPGEEDPMGLLRALEESQRLARRLRHAIRQLDREDPHRAQLEAQLADAQRRSQELRAHREAEYAE
ncbi:MAG TPA: DUF1616 domain-containing protein [Thermoplasmata archaeon]|nr:DUF1616 domain-containing protein [Thermoplasmata archaeon]